MKFKLERYGIEIVPETKQDEAYIEDTLCLKRTGQSIQLTRCSPLGLDTCLGWLEAKPMPERVDRRD